MDLLAATRVTLALAMLAGAALLDLRSRRVANAYWLPFAAAAAALLAVAAGGTEPRAWATQVAVAGMVAAGAYAAWRLRLFGGADAKGLMVLAFLVPDVMTGLPTEAGGALAAGFGFPFALHVLMNGTLLAAAFPLVLLAWNAAHGRLRLPAALLGHPLPIAEARRRHVWPMQRMEEGQMRWRHWGFIGMDTDEAYDALEAAGHKTVWVTAKVPLMTLVAAGAALALARGNLLLELAVRVASP